MRGRRSGSLVLEGTGQPLVPAFRHPGHVFDGPRELRIEVDGKFGVSMTWMSNRSHWTLFRPKYWQRREGTGPADQADERAPERGGNVDPGHPPAPRHQEPAQYHEEDEPEVDHQGKVGKDAIDHRSGAGVE
jgi:hypothetical protein